MGVRRKLEKRSSALLERAADSSISTSERIADGFRGFRQVLAAGEQTGAEAYLTALVAAVRSDSREEGEVTSRDVYLRARKRRRTLGLACLGTGPAAGTASRVADLYCEIATLCDVADLHGLTLDDSQVAAHMLVLWSIVPDREEAEGVVRGEPPLAQVLEAKLSGRVSLAKGEEGWTPRSIAAALWDVQAGAVVGDLKEVASGQPVRSVLFTGHRMKKVIKSAEAQLGAEPERSRRWRR